MWGTLGQPTFQTLEIRAAMGCLLLSPITLRKQLSSSELKNLKTLTLRQKEKLRDSEYPSVIAKKRNTPVVVV